MPDMTIIICAAVPILLISFFMFLSNILFTVRAKKTTGTVIGHVSNKNSQSGLTHAEVVEFQGPDGKRVQFTEKAYRGKLILIEGHTVNVLYDPNNPIKARINSFGTLYLAPLILLVVGLGLLLFSTPMFRGTIINFLTMLQNFVEKIPFL